MDIRIDLLLEQYSYKEVLLTQRSQTLDLDAECLFTIQESDYIYATFDFDPGQIRLEIENAITGELDEVQSGARFLLTDGREETTAFYPGRFRINIYVDDNRYERLFFVAPKNLSFQNVLEIRNLLNAFYEGLSLDLLKKRLLDNVNYRKSELTPVATNYMFLLDNMPQLLNLSTQYMKAGKTDTIKEGELSYSSKKMSPQSVKWLAQKGMTVNKNVNDPDVILIRKTKHNVDNLANRVFKGELVFWNGELGRSIKAIQSYIDDLNDRQQSLQTEQAELQQHLATIDSDKKIARSVIRSTQGRLHDYEKALNDNMTLINDFQAYLSGFKRYKTFFEYSLYNTWVDGIHYSQTYGKLTHADQRLSSMRRIRNEYLGIKQKSNKKNNDRHIGFSEKSTPKLFETYVYTMLISLLRRNGFELEDLDLYQDNIIYKLSTSGTVTLNNGDRICDIIYDMPLRRSNDKFTDSEYVTVNAKHNRPDFILSVKDSDGHLINTMIFEVKWRPLGNIYNELDDTEVVETLKDYFNLAYHNHDTNKTERGVVSTVVVVYPDLSERTTNIQNDEILALGILPESKPFQNRMEELIKSIL